MDDQDVTREPDPAEVPEAASVMRLLAEHVPLTLLADLAVAEPRSEAILRAEGLPDDAWWAADDTAPGAVGDDAPGCGTPVVEDAVPVDPDAAGPADAPRTPAAT